ncbi:hypothetical protein [Nitrosococcus wardiae]|uniref:hypothetical protein n=1 Tax=Nitrosococcus wardiae TaxID=1814290 RepID=UPI00141B4067|nr:hypothetical protein [Nitrosococcus wardiae]
MLAWRRQGVIEGAGHRQNLLCRQGMRFSIADSKHIVGSLASTLAVIAHPQEEAADWQTLASA